jgi:two-component system, NarL family, invasion response regulator UvrY
MNIQKKILLVDDHPIVTCGMHYIISLNFQGCVIGEASSLKQMQTVLRGGNYTHLILDLNLGDGNAIDVIPVLNKKYPKLKILIYSMASEKVYARKLLRMGTSGFLSKSVNEFELLARLEAFFLEDIFTPVTTTLFKKAKKADSSVFGNLSINEMRVLGLILNGHKTKAIAANLNVTSQTIAKYKSRIFKKTGTENLFDIQKMADLHHIDFP